MFAFCMNVVTIWCSSTLLIADLLLSQILEDYDSQIQHLSKELEGIGKDFDAWEGSKPGFTSGRAR